MHHVLVLATPTEGDKEFYTRWQKIGAVHQGMPNDPRSWEKIDVIVTDHNNPITSFHIQTFKALRVIASANTGHTHFKVDIPKSIKLITLKGETNFLKGITSVSEYVLWQALNYFKPSSNIKGKKVSLIGGLGRIGTHVAQRFKAFGAEIFYVHKESTTDQWEAAFRQADVVSIHLPETPSTRRLVSRELIWCMKPNALFVNTARGSVVDELALADALRKNVIGLAAVDVVEKPELLHSGIPNLRLTPHIAGSSFADRVRTDEFICGKVDEYLKWP